MSHKFTDKFYWFETVGQEDKGLTEEEQYNKVVSWARKARGKNPGAFDALTEWMWNDSEWILENVAENEQIFMQGVLARFLDQNNKLRAYLSNLKRSGIVNDAVFKALDRFDEELSGKTAAAELQNSLSEIFSDFITILDPKIRKRIAGGKTGPTGTDTVEFYGYINHLKDCDAAVQWALFMPDLVKSQQKGFKIQSFEYKKMMPMRFVGCEWIEHDPSDMSWELKIMKTLDSMSAYKSGFDYDVLLMHHYGKGVDIEPCHGFWGRFMKAGTPVPEGMIGFDFRSHRAPGDFNPGPPFLSQFAFAVFSGDTKAMHQREGYDCDAMYDVTRNIILGEGVNIPYPDQYWTAEVFLSGCDQPSTAYMFSAEL